MSDRDERDWPPGDEPPPDEEELALARRLGAATDSLLEGSALPDAVERDELFAAARMIRSAGGAEEHLSSERKQELVQQALEEAGQSVARPARRPAVLRAAPYLALAASVVLLLSALWVGLPSLDRAAPAAPTPQPELLSRSSDDLMGRPFKDRAGASRRLDLVFADRLHGYRQVRLAARTTTVTP